MTFPNTSLQSNTQNSNVVCSMLKGEPLGRFQLSVLKQNLTNYLSIRLPISNRSKKKSKTKIIFWLPLNFTIRLWAWDFYRVRPRQQIKSE